MNAQFSKILKNARECQILGNYEESIADYQKAIPMVQQSLASCRDPQLRQQWKTVFEALNKELQLAVETNQIKQSFKADFHATDRGRDLPVEIVTPDNRMVIQQSKPMQQPV